MRRAAWAAPLFAASMLSLCLAGCSGLAATNEEMPVTGPDPGYNKLVATHINNTFKDRASYADFEISEYRWVHTIKGWTWVTCVRFQDQSHTRFYAVYIQGNKIVDSRYAVQTDGCGTLAYTPFEVMTGAGGGPSILAPLH